MDFYLKLVAQIQNFFKHDLVFLRSELEGKILRLEVQIPSLEPLSWLAAQNSAVKTYWCDRQVNFTMAGVGTLDIIAGDLPIDYSTIFGKLRKKLSPLFPQVRYYGGIGFSQDLPIDPNWKLFGNYRFIIPRFEILVKGSDSFFACNFSCTLNSEQLNLELELILQELAQLNFTESATRSDLPLQIDLSALTLCDRIDRPNRTEWSQNIEFALAQFTDLDLDKIVLARQSTLTFATDIQPQLLLQSLKSNNSNSYHFCFQIDHTTAFIGTSPERLYHRKDRLFQTEAIAGTRQRGGSSQLDQELSEDLLNSSKDLHEHQLVVNNLQVTLAELCDSVTIDQELTILKLHKVQHLYTQYQGILKAQITDADLLPKLHPTPAVGGFPRTPALKLIKELEPFERGWYAAPVGWVGYDETEFAVAIRSGLIVGGKPSPRENRQRLLLYAGAGIVRGSQSADEWAEIENKIRHFTDLFNNIR
jgi:menaquinone-specific isochorismate synthase